MRGPCVACMYCKGTVHLVQAVVPVAPALVDVDGVEIVKLGRYPYDDIVVGTGTGNCW